LQGHGCGEFLAAWEGASGTSPTETKVATEKFDTLAKFCRLCGRNLEPSEDFS